MARIAWIEDADATGPVAEVYRQWKSANPDRHQIPDILKCFSLRPDALKNIVELVYPLHFSDGFLDRRTKEMIATFVSGLNHCPY